MAETLLQYEAQVRLGCFLAIMAAMMAWEVWTPRRRRAQPRRRRWSGNLGIVVVNTVFVRLIFPVMPVAVALAAAGNGWGLLNLVALPSWLAGVLAFVLLDLAIYGQHMMFHHVPPLWRLHRMHHADLDFDVTTGLRFHPIEIFLSLLIKMAVVVALGAPAAAVIVFEVVLNGTSLFNHANVRLPGAMDRWLRLIVVTPDMHRVHHSIHRDETDSNFGFNLPWWDRLFATYRDQPGDGHQGMTIGIPQFRDPEALGLHRLLIQPFLNPEPPSPETGGQ